MKSNIEKASVSVLPALVSLSAKPLLTISSSLLKQISAAHKLCGATEWSGTLLFIDNGKSYNQLDQLELEALGFIPHDIGTQTSTEYSANADTHDAFFDYCDAYDIQQCIRGQIHTHHTMQTFFSGTDTEDLINGALSCHQSYYLSLIVNFSGVYTARIAYKITQDITNKVGTSTFVTQRTEVHYAECRLRYIEDNPYLQNGDYFFERLSALKKERDSRVKSEASLKPLVSEQSLKKSRTGRVLTYLDLWDYFRKSFELKGSEDEMKAKIEKMTDSEITAITRSILRNPVLRETLEVNFSKLKIWLGISENALSILNAVKSDPDEHRPF